jgi:hypothetical protein
MAGRHDQGARRRAVRRGRETGCWVYIPGEQLDRCGIPAERGQPPPFYRTWDGRKRTVLVQLYEEA